MGPPQLPFFFLTSPLHLSRRPTQREAISVIQVQSHLYKLDKTVYIYRITRLALRWRQSGRGRLEQLHGVVAGAVEPRLHGDAGLLQRISQHPCPVPSAARGAVVAAHHELRPADGTGTPGAEKDGEER